MIRLISIFLLSITFFSCKENAEKKNRSSQNDTLSKIDIKSENIIFNDDKTDENSFDINGTWNCYKYVVDDRIEKKYAEDYAKEISKYSRFQINNNKLMVGNCTKDAYTYVYPTKLKKFDDESLFITYFKPKQDSINFIGTINTGNDTDCNIFDNFTYYVYEKDNIIQYDRGYFFYYKKFDKSENLFEGLKIVGIPGNNRNEWQVKWETKKHNSLDEAYAYFIKSFPYGAKNLSISFPASNEYVDKSNGVLYYRNNDELKIIKDDPLGKINLKIIKNKNNTISFTYEMQYPDY